MDYNAFKNKLLQCVKSKLENAEIKNYTKNNSIEKEGIYIYEEGKNFNPLIHLDDLYGLYQLTGDMDGVAELVFEMARTTSGNIDVQAILGSWENAQSRLTVRLINSAQELREEKRKPTPYDGINYIMTNPEGQFGARGMLRTDLLIQFAETVHEDLYILPDSINDIILTPAIKELTDEDLSDMMAVIKVFNKPEQDSLSDNMYYFSRESGEISIYTPKTEEAVL